VRAWAGTGDVVCLSATAPGSALAQRLPYRHVHGDVGGSLRREWSQVRGIVVMLAVGATVRLIAPLLTDKAGDPCVVCVDDAGRYAVVVTGAHAGGGNALAEAVAAMLGAEAVVTTATDVLGLPALDGLPGLRAEGDVAAVTSALIAGQPVELRNALGWPVPEALASRCTGGPGAASVVVSDELVRSGSGPVALLRPPSLVVGIGTSSDATAGEVRHAVTATLAAAGLSAGALGLLATVERRADHPAVLGAAEELGVPVAAFPADVLDAVAVPAPSDVVRKAVGTGSVAEAAAIAASGRGGRLVVGKCRFARATVAVGRRGGPVGCVAVVGLGPGSPDHRTPAAERAVRRADVVVGLSSYVEQCGDLVGPAQRVLAFPLGAEIERARAALAEAMAGNRVAVVCSGDAGIYAMASPLLELPESAGVPVEVVPGVTAGSATAALLGAPLGHDHAVISLSDLHTPWPVIEARLQAAAEADFAVVLYNPRSARRTWQLEAARKILRSHRPDATPVGLVTGAGRPGERLELTTLGAMDADRVTMATCVIVGSSRTRIVGGRMVTPRGYLTAP
jgi:cobalt-precorrin 5A hydrolase / precorrin-3B C17-methyltransferase